MINYATNSNQRQKAQKIIFIISIIITSAITILLNCILVNYTQTNIWINYINLFAMPSIGAIYAVLWHILDVYLWKCKPFYKLLGFPDLNGKWIIKGKNNIGVDYDGKLQITQTLSKITIKGLFEKSESKNIESYLYFDEECIKLSYHYINEPKIKEGTMGIHYGFASIQFDKKLQKISGKYFNDEFRCTNGTWQISRNIECDSLQKVHKE